MTIKTDRRPKWEPGAPVDYHCVSVLADHKVYADTPLWGAAHDRLRGKSHQSL